MNVNQTRGAFGLYALAIIMGTTSSSTTRSDGAENLFAFPSEKAAFEKIVSELSIPREDAAYTVLLNAPRAFTHLTKNEVEYLNQQYGGTLGR